MRVAPPGGFTVKYFQDAFRAGDLESKTHERIELNDAFRENHRTPKTLTTKSLSMYVWNGICCTCCILATEESNLRICEDNDKAVLEEVRKAKEHNQPYNLVFIEYKPDKLGDIDKLIAEVTQVSSETKVLLLTIRNQKLAAELRSKGYFAISGMEMMDQAFYDSLIAEVLGDEGIERLRKN